jgi:hypothetical protein
MASPAPRGVTIGVFDLDQIVPTGRAYQGRSMPPHGHCRGHAPSQEAAMNKTTAVVAFALLLIGSAAGARENMQRNAPLAYDAESERSAFAQVRSGAAAIVLCTAVRQLGCAAAAILPLSGSMRFCERAKSAITDTV